MPSGAHHLNTYKQLGAQKLSFSAGQRSVSRSRQRSYRAPMHAIGNASKRALQRARLSAYRRANDRASQRAFTNARCRAWQRAFGCAIEHAVMVREMQRVITPSTSPTLTQLDTPVQRGTARLVERPTLRVVQGAGARTYSRDPQGGILGVQSRPKLSGNSRDGQRGDRAYGTAPESARGIASKRACASALDHTCYWAVVSAWPTALDRAQPTRGVLRVAGRVETR